MEWSPSKDSGPVLNPVLSAGAQPSTLKAHRKDPTSNSPSVAAGSLGNGKDMAVPAQGSPADGTDEEQVVRFSYEDQGKMVTDVWSENHCKLVYLVARWGRAALRPDQKESWIRQIPMLVLIFQCIVDGILDFDYAPSSMLVSYGGRSKRMWVNVSQEAKSALDDLREKAYLNAIKLITEDFQPILAYQVSERGLRLLQLVPQSMKDEVNRVIFAPPEALMPGEARQLVQVRYVHAPQAPEGGGEEEGGGDSFALCHRQWSKRSHITESEDVSYVSSPFLPECLRSQSSLRRGLSSNRHRADECATGQSGIADELSEAIVLREVKTLIGEWIPFGSNQIVSLNERLGALDRCQGGLFTAIVDHKPTDTQFNVPPGLTQVTILDYNFTNFINFEAEIHYPEHGGVIQVENFGMHLSVDGSIVYGVIIDAVLDRKSDHVSLDHLSRLLVDVHMDSTKIMDDLLSQYQRSLLDTMFLGDASMRNKFNLILCETMEPLLPADDYMDKGEYENELKQVLGDIREAFDVTKTDIIIVGKDGLLACGEKLMKYEQMLLTYLAMLVREIFIRNFFVRLFVLDDLLSKIRRLITTHYEDPNYVAQIRLLLNQGSRDVILLEEILEYLKESLDEIRLPPQPEEAIGRRLQKMLDINNMKNDILMRCEDLRKLINGSSNELTTLQNMSETITTKQLEDVFNGVSSNTKFLVDASAAQERASASLEVMQVILSGSFAFDILDRISGGTLNIELTGWFYKTWVVYLLAWPGFFWLLNMIWLCIVCGAIKKLMSYLAEKATGALSVKMKLDRAVHMEQLKAYIKSKTVKVFEINREELNIMRKARWEEEDATHWGGAPPTIELLYDELNAFLWEVSFTIDAKTTVYREQELLATFVDDLERNGVWRHEINEALNLMPEPAEDAKKSEDPKGVLNKNMSEKALLKRRMSSRRSSLIGKA